MKKNIKEWCAAIFDDQDYSFAQLDFIQRMDKSLFLVDFSARTGGGLNMLLSKAAPKELYAIAICYALGKGNTIPRVEEHWAQYNIFSGMSEFTKYLITSNATTEYISLPTSVESKCLISSVNARIALILNHEASIDSFMQNCEKYKALLASEYCISIPREDSSIVNSNNRNLSQSSIIDNKDAEKFLLSLEKHNISKDICFLVQRLHNFSPGKLLDVGFGSGMLLRALLRSQFSLFGIEKSHVLYNNLNDSHPNANLFNDDLFNWESCEKFEIIIFSFILHHVKNPFDALIKFIPMLATNGCFFIVDRIAISDEDKCAFLPFWNNIYKNEHEWYEDCPIILTRKEYEKFFIARGFSVQFERYPHDIREGTDGFPKTLLIASR